MVYENLLIYFPLFCILQVFWRSAADADICTALRRQAAEKRLREAAISRKRNFLLAKVTEDRI